MSNKTNSAGGGVGFIGLLTIAFIVLKLCGVIKWHWAWVFSPMWIGGGIAIGIILLIVIFLIGSYIMDIHKEEQQERRREKR